MAVLLSLALATLVLSNLSGSLAHQKVVDQFTRDASQTTSQLQGTLNEYADVLYSGRSFVLNSQAVYSSEWTGFYRSQDIFNRHKGMSSISYIEVVPAAQKGSFLARQRAQPELGPSYAITPPGERETYGLATLTVSPSGIKPSGFDVFSTTDRKAVFQAAQDSGQPAASGQTKFSNGATGMFVTLPLARQGTTVGFVHVALHTDDFFSSVVDTSQLGPMSMKVTDVTDSQNKVKLYASPQKDYGATAIAYRDNIDFGGRVWQIDYTAPYNYTQGNVPAAIPYMVLIIGLLFDIILAGCFYLLLKSAPMQRAAKQGRHVKKTTTTTVTTLE